MSLETGTYIDDLVVTNPLSSDARSEGDDHIRLIKSVLKNTFPNVAGAVNATHTELGYVAGVTSAIQTQLDALLAAVALRPQMAITTVTVFYQATAPVGWTQVTTHNNKALRVVSGVGAGSGGSVAFTSAFASKTPAGTIGGTALTTAQIPSHTHNIKTTANGTGGGGGSGQFVASGGTSTGATEAAGSGSTHTHTFTGTAIDLAVQYIDLIIASRSS